MSAASKRQLFFHPFIILLLVLGCAKQGYPPGGPEDRTPPKILVTIPPSGAVNTPGDLRVRIEFSERIDQTTVDKAVFISPRSDPPPNIRVKNDAVEIVPETAWQADKTYIITIGTDLRDAHNVNMAQSMSIAFSTGASIDSGTISGTVYKDGTATRGISVGLFSDDPGATPKQIDSITPDYQTQTGDNGAFALSFLPPGTYYLAAFEDRNKNRRIDFGREMIGLPFKPAQLPPGSPDLSGIDMQLFSSDTSTIGFRSVSMNSDGLLKLRFTQPMDNARAAMLFSTISLRPVEDSAGEIAISDYTPVSPYPSPDYLFLTGTVTPDSQYRVSLDLSPLHPAIPDSLRIISYTFRAPPIEDKTAPTLLEVIPGGNAVNVHPDSLFVIRSSEPLDIETLKDAARLIYGEADTLTIVLSPDNQFQFAGAPETGLRFGRTYRWLLLEDMIQDRAGNLLGDSVRSFSFSTIGRDTLGYMSGAIQYSHPDDSAFPVIVSFHPAREGAPGQIRVGPATDQFRAELLPGYYTISAFLDRNDNGKYDFGSLVPYRLAEPFTVQVDTVRVRTRFESAGVVVSF